jgi:mannitol/fructose-specific phosphotransferase system IIA component (Ntr-type)
VLEGEMMSVFSPQLIDLHLAHSDKHEAILKLAAMVVDSGRGDNAELITRDVLARDAMGTPQIDGIAIPHARTDGVQTSCVVVARSQGVQFGQGEDSAKIIIMILVPIQAGDEHIKILSHLARKLIEPKVKEVLHNAEDPLELIKVLDSD